MIKTDGKPTIAWADPPQVEKPRPHASELKKLSLERTDCDLAESA